MRFYSFFRQCAVFLNTVCVCLGVASCIPTKNISEGDYLLVNQQIEGNEQVDTEELELLLKQKPNRRILNLPIMPYLYAYRIGEKRFRKQKPKLQQAYRQKEVFFGQKEEALRNEFDSLLSVSNSYNITNDSLRLLQELQKLQAKKNDKLRKLSLRIEKGNWLMRSVGEAPTLFDSALTAQTTEQMTLYLLQNGYFHATVTSHLSTKKKKAEVTYQVKEDSVARIENIIYTIADSTLRSLVLADTGNALFHVGDIYRETSLEEERNRLTRMLNNTGYFDFGVSYIFFEIDTLEKPFSPKVELIIKNPPGERQHTRFEIDEVVFEADASVSRNRRALEDTVYLGIRYIEEKKRYSKKVLNRKIFIRPDSLYSLLHTEQTQRALARLDIFKFVNINYDTLGGKFKANIFTSPYDRFQYSLEGGLNVTQALPGPFVSASFKNRNTFGGCEILEIRGRFGIEAQAGVTEDSGGYNSQEYGGNISLSFPQILFPLGQKWRSKLAAGLPRTQLSLGYSFVDRPEYSRTNIQGALTYQWRNRRNARFEFKLLELGIVYTGRLSDSFAQRLDELAAQGNTLALSFDRSLVSSFVASYIQASDSYGTTFERTHYFRAYIESGGNYLNFIDRTLLENDDLIFGLRFFRFAKVSFDYRFALPFGENKELVSRINMGVAKPYGSGQQGLPYEKYFFTGGSNSNRAWRPRRLGPGSYTPPVTEDGTFDYSFEQGGEVLIEANTELRGHLFSFFDYAFFIDASNIWMTETDPSRPGALFELRDFWKELAIGSGVGLRLDFSFLLIRFDLGIKLFDPALPEGHRFIGDQLSFRKPLGAPGQSTLNIGVGYPF